MTLASRILLAGDEKPQSSEWIEELASLDVEIVKAASLAAVLTHIRISKFVAVVINGNTFDVNSLEIAKSIRDCDSMTPILLVVDNMEPPETLKQIYALGNIDYLVKPEIGIIVHSRLNILLKMHRQHLKILRFEEEKRRSELRAQNGPIRLVLDNIRDYAFIVTDPDGRIIEWEGGAENITGWLFEDVYRSKVDLIFTPADRAANLPHTEIERARENGKFDDKRWYLRRDGTPFFADGVMIALKKADGKIRGFAKIFRDDTARKLAEGELQQSKNLFSLILESSGEGIYGVGRDGKCIFMNKAGAAMLGYAPGELQGRTIHHLIHHSYPDGSTYPVEDCRIAVATRDGYAIRVDDEVFWHKSGGPIPVSYSVNPILLDGKPEGAVVTFSDDSVKRHAKAALEASEERYRTLFNSIDEGFALIELIFDQAGIPTDYLFLETNPVFEEQTGLIDAAGKTAKTLVPTLEPHWFETYGKVALTGEPVRFVEGSAVMNRWFSVYATRVGDGLSRKVVLLFSDISERKKAETDRERLLNDVQNAHEQMVNMFQQAPAFICTTRGPRHEVAMVNERYLQLVGRRDIIGKPVEEAIPEVAEQGYVALLDEVYQSGKIFVGTDARVRLQRSESNESEERIIDFVYVPLKDVSGDVSGIFVHGVDITERKHAEESLLALASDLADANKRKTEFLATLAHELRNPLAPIMTGLEVMRLSANDPAVINRLREMMQRQGKQMIHLIDDLLDIARINSGKVELKREHVSLQSVLSNAVEASMPLIQAHQHTFTLIAPSEPSHLHVDPTRVSQVLTNMLTNAAKYTPQGGTISLRASISRHEVTLQVVDNGMGIPEESLPGIFDMFTQVGRNMSRAQGGLGIGLSLVRGLVEMHGGSVEVSSGGVGKGSIFTVRLPLVEENTSLPSTHVIDRRSEERDKSTLRILVADDNVDAAEMLGTLLKISGHITHVVHDGLDALRAATEFRPDVAFIDIGMPGMNGFQVATAIRELPGINQTLLIALSGWGTEEDRLLAEEAGFDQHFTKPAELTKLQALLANFQKVRL